MPLSLTGADIKPLVFPQPGKLPTATPAAPTPATPTAPVTAAPKPTVSVRPTTPAPVTVPKPAVPAPVPSTRPTSGAPPAQLPVVKPLPVTGIPGVATQQFGPSRDLRSTAVLPTAGPDRFKMAEDRYGQFITDTAERDFDATRMLGQRAAALGRTGSGMVSKDYADLGGAIERERGNTRNKLLTDALEGTIQDARNNRAEVRGERDYETGSAQQSLQNRLAQLQAEESLTQGQFGRDFSVTQLLAQLGFGGSGVGELLQGAGQQQENADAASGGVAELLRQYGLGQSVGPYGTGGVPTGTPGYVRPDPALMRGLTDPSYYGNRPGTYTY